jgi:hypothetical protein
MSGAASVSEFSVSVLRKAGQSSALPLMPCLNATEKHDSHQPTQLPTTTLKPRTTLHFKRKWQLTSLDPEEERRTCVVLTPKYSFPNFSVLNVSSKRDFSSVIEQSETNGSKRSKNYSKSDYLRIGKDATSSLLLPTDLRRETPNQVINLRPRKTRDSVTGLLDF